MQGLASGRATGMAEAVSTLSDDLAGWPYNPGTLGTLTAPQISGTFSRGLAADRLSIVSYGHPTRLGTFAGAIAYYNGGKEELAASDGSLYSVQLQRDVLGSISYANHVGVLNLGASGKFIRSELAEAASANAFAADFGAVVKFPSSNFSIGVALRNLGQRLRFLEESDALPLEVRCGGSYLWPLDGGRSDLLLSADVPYAVNEKEFTGKVGAEYSWHHNFVFAAGYHINSGALGATFGFGLLLEQVAFTYGFGLGNVTGTHSVSLGYRFGEDAAREPEPAAESLPRAKTAMEPSQRHEPEPAPARIPRASEVPGRDRSTAAPESADDKVRDLEEKGFVSYLSQDLAGARSDYMQAIALAKKAGLSESPSLARAYLGLGLCLAESGDKAHAVKAFQKGLEAGPSDDTKRELEDQLARLKRATD